MAAAAAHEHPAPEVLGVPVRPLPAAVCPMLPLLLDSLPVEVASQHLLRGVSDKDRSNCRLACSAMARMLGCTVSKVKIRAGDIPTVNTEKLKERFPHVICVHVLDHGKQYVKDRDLEDLLRRCFRAWLSLRELDLRGCNHLTTYGLHAVGQLCSKLGRLSSLSLPRWTDNLGLRGLTHLTGLTSLELGDPHMDVIMINDGGLECLRGLSALRVLSLERCAGLTDVGLRWLGALKDLRQLNLSRTSIIGTGLSSLEAAAKLHTLNLSDCRCLADSGLSALSLISSLQELNLSNTPITNSGLEAMSYLGFLQTLTLGNKFSLQDSGLLALSHCPALTSLKLGSVCLTQPMTHPMTQQMSQQHVRPLPTLGYLELGGLYAQTGLEWLFPLPALMALRLQGFDSVTDNVLAEVSKQTSLTSLSLSGGYQLSPAGMHHLRRLPLLSVLELAVCPHIVPACLAPFQGLTRISIRSCPQLPATAEGVSAILPEVHVVMGR